MGRTADDKRAALKTARLVEASAKKAYIKEVTRLDRSTSPGEFDMHYPYMEKASELHNDSIANTNDAKRRAQKTDNGKGFKSLTHKLEPRAHDRAADKQAYSSAERDE